MSHVDEGTLQAWIDDALSEVELKAVDAHVAACATCAAEARTLRELAQRATECLSGVGEPPVADLATFAALRRRARRPAVTRGLSAGLARAAMLLLALAGVVAAAVPGSPLRQWLEDAFGGETVPAPAPQEEPASVTPESTPVAAPAAEQEIGPAVALEAGRITIRLLALHPSVAVRVLVADEAEASVLYSSSNRDARSTSASGRIDLANVNQGRVTIVIPRAAVEAMVEVNGSAWWQKVGTEVRILGPGSAVPGEGTVFSARS